MMNTKPEFDTVEPRRTASLFGIRAPRTCALFDTRFNFESPAWDGKLVSEKIAAQVGIASHYSAPQMIGCQTYQDHRELKTEDGAAMLRSIRSHVAKAWRGYRRALRTRRPNRNGGSAYYAPLFVSFGNYGWTLHGSPTTKAVYPF